MAIAPDANVVFTGDLFWRDLLPNLIDASLTLWIESLTTLEKSGSTFVPGHGEVGTADDLVNAVVPSLKEKYGGWGWFDLAKPNIADAEAELNGTKRIPKP